MLNYNNLQLIVNTILHVLNWIFTLSLFITIGLLINYVTDMYMENTLLTMIFTIILFYLLSVPFNFLEHQIDKLCG